MPVATPARQASFAVEAARPVSAISRTAAPRIAMRLSGLLARARPGRKEYSLPGDRRSNDYRLPPQERKRPSVTGDTGYASLSNSVRYLGASAFTFSMNAVCAFSSSFGGGVVRGDRHPDLHEEFLLPRGRADAEHTCGAGGGIVKLMRSVGRNVQRVAGSHARLLAAEGRFHLTFEQDKGLLEVMPMWRRSATWRDVHVDDAEASVGLLARHGDGVGIADETDVREVVGLRQRETAFEVVRR